MGSTRRGKCMAGAGLQWVDVGPLTLPRMPASFTERIGRAPQARGPEGEGAKCTGTGEPVTPMPMA